MKKKLVIILLFIVILFTGCTNDEDNDIVTRKPEEPEVKKEVTGDYDVTVNLFHWNSCSHCKEEIEWLKYLDEKYDNIKIKYFEVDEEAELVSKVREEFGIDNTSVPLTVIGTDYYIGFGASSKAKLMTVIEEYSSFENCDIVKKIINNKDTESCYIINANE